MIERATYQHVTQKIIEFEEQRRLPPEALDFLYENQLFKLFVPSEVSGKELNLVEGLETIREVSKINGNLGWLISTGAGAGYFYGYMKPEIAYEVFHRKESVIAGSGHPSGIATPVENGYRITGSWKYCSGADFATHFTFNCKVNGNPDHIQSIILDPDQVTVLPDWKGFGLKSTSTHTVVVKDAFVDKKHTFDLMKPPHHPAPVYRFPFLPFAQASIAVVNLGIAEVLLKEAESIVEKNKSNWQTDQSSRMDILRNKFVQAKQNLDYAQRDFMTTIQRACEILENQQPLAEDWHTKIGMHAKKLSRASLNVGTNLLPYLGMSVVKEDEYINHLWRDLQTASQHVLIIPFAEMELMDSM